MNSKKNVMQFYTHLFKDLKDLSRMLTREKSGNMKKMLLLKGLFHPAFLARVVSWFAFVVAIFMAHDTGDIQRPTKRRQMQEMLGETDPLSMPLFPFLNGSWQSATQLTM